MKYSVSKMALFSLSSAQKVPVSVLNGPHQDFVESVAYHVLQVLYPPDTCTHELYRFEDCSNYRHMFWRAGNKLASLEGHDFIWIRAEGCLNTLFSGRQAELLPDTRSFTRKYSFCAKYIQVVFIIRY